MKKIFALLILSLAFVLGTNGQITGFDEALDYSQTYRYLVNQDNVFSTGDSIWMYSIHKKTYQFIKPSLLLELDSTGGTFDTVKIYLESKDWDGDTYEIQDSIYWTTGADTVKQIQISTGVQDAIWRTRIIGENDEFRFNIDFFGIRFYY